MKKHLVKLKSKLYLPDFFAKLFELFFNPFFGNYERNQRKKWNSHQSGNPPIFIIGPPRSGSTLLYQLIASSFEVTYISNFTNIFAHALFLGFSLEKRFFGGKYISSMKSDHGRTFSSGWMGPNESPRFWYKVLPTNRHSVAYHELDESKRQYLYDYINGIGSKYNKPFVFKNLNASVRLDLLSKLFPNAKFIFIQRDTFFNAQSIWKGRKKKGLQKAEWWSVKPANFDELLKLPEEEMIVRQVVEIEQTIINFFEENNSESVLKLSYESLCENPTENLALLSEFIGLPVRENKLDISGIKLSQKITVPKEVEKQLRSAIRGNKK